MLELHRRFHLEAAHRLERPSDDGCGTEIHGHSWTVDAYATTVAGRHVDGAGRMLEEALEATLLMAEGRLLVSTKDRDARELMRLSELFTPLRVPCRPVASELAAWWAELIGDRLPDVLTLTGVVVAHPRCGTGLRGRTSLSGVWRPAGPLP